MIAIRKNNEMEWLDFEKCHDGEGVLRCKSLFDGFEKSKFNFMHCDDMKAGVSIGVHQHVDNEEIYYLVSGSGILTYDDVEYEMQAGDISLCTAGHSHAFLATTDSILVVVG